MMRIRAIILLYVTLLLYSSPALPQKEHPQKPIILWDLHGVFFDQKNFVLTFLTYPDLIPLVTHVSAALITDILRHGITNIEYLDLMKHNNPYFEEFILRMVNTMDPIATMDTLAEELAALGYEQHLASNIGSLAFNELTDPLLYPQYAPFFTLFNLPASQTGHLAGKEAIKKPYLRYFEEYLAKNELNPYERSIIFIDDNRRNIQAARALGFDTIHFKHPYQLRMELIKRGIPITPPPYYFSSQLTPVHFHKKFYSYPSNAQ